MDAAYPNLHYRIFNDGPITFNFGTGSGGNIRSESGQWGLCWGGGGNETGHLYPAYTSSIEINEAFQDVDEFWECLDRGIARQVCEDHPTCDYVTRTKDKNTGRVTIEPKINEHIGTQFTVHLVPYPSSCPPSNYKEEYRDENEGMLTCNSNLGTLSRWGFSFALPRDWRDSVRNHTFSFAAQFPKCAKWLTFSTKYYWMRIEAGKLAAFNKKSSAKGDVPVYETMKQKSLHLMFLDMEQMIQLPASWEKSVAKKRSRTEAS